MSVVHQALRKAAQEKQRQTGVIPALPPAPVARPARDPSSPPPPAVRPLASPVATGPAVAAIDRPVVRRPVPVLLVALAVGTLAVFAVAIAFAWKLRRSGDGRAADAPTPARVTAAADPAPPTVPPAPAEPGPGVTPVATGDVGASLHVTGIMQAPDGRNCAVINGHIVYEDSLVEGAVVKQIERDRVTLEINGRRVVKGLY